MHESPQKHIQAQLARLGVLQETMLGTTKLSMLKAHDINVMV